MKHVNSDYMMHESSYRDEDVALGLDVKIWHFCHLCKGCSIGDGSVLGQNVYIGPGVQIGWKVKIQNNVSVYEGVTIEDEVFLGPSCVFTNVKNPRAGYPTDEYPKTLVKRGASIGANATIVCGVTLGEWCFIGAGAVVTKDVSPHALMVGVPAQQIGVVDKEGNVVRV